MPQPLALCLETVEPDPGEDRFLRCVALVGRPPGLRLDPRGTPVWKDDRHSAAELWVSGDDRLILYRPRNAPPIQVHRASRHLEVPEEKPVVLLHGDELTLGTRRLRVHLHGPAPRVHPPEPLRPAAPQPTSRLAAALALSAALGAAHCKRDTPPADAPNDIEVRTQPPVVVPFDPPDAGPPFADAEPTPPEPDTATSAPDAATSAPDAATTAPEPDAEIEVRVAPPQVPAPRTEDVLDPNTLPPSAPPAPDDAGTTDARDASDDAGRDDGRSPRPDAARPPPIEVRDNPPFVEM